MPAKTTAQVIVDFSTGELDAPNTQKYDKFRVMRRDATIGLVRKYSVAPTLASTWAFEGEDQDQVSLIKQVMEPMRTHLLRTAMYGERDFGWKAYEKIFAIRDVAFPSGLVDKSQVLDQVKPLKNGITRVRYRKEDGRFEGLATENLYTGEKILIDAAHSLFVNFDDEGLGDYAEGRMHRAEDPYDDWLDANESARKFDRKMAGSFLIVEFPEGELPYKNNGGVLTPTYTIADDTIKALKASGQVAIPRARKQMGEPLAESEWTFKLLEPQSKQPAFVDRQKYLDALKARAYEVPERAVLEGEFGTKAEAGIHASAALLNMHLEHVQLVEFFNWHIVNQLLMLNWGVENTVRIKANPLTNEQTQLFTTLLTTLLADPAAGADIADKIDVEGLLDAAGVPMRALEEDEPAEEAKVHEASLLDDQRRMDETATRKSAPVNRMNGAPSRVSVTVG